VSEDEASGRAHQDVHEEEQLAEMRNLHSVDEPLLLPFEDLPCQHLSRSILSRHEAQAAVIE
jgi:hypothetical protein